jgi:type IV secretion system protein VirB10
MEQEVKDKTLKPQGLMPKNLQALIIAGIALVMIVIMALTGRKAPAPVTAPATPPPPSPVDQARILSFRHDIQQQQADSATKLEEALLERQKRISAGETPPPAGIQGYPTGTQPAAAAADSIKEEEKKRRYESLFADNVALTYRKDAAPQQPPRPDLTLAQFPPGLDPRMLQTILQLQQLAADVRKSEQSTQPAAPPPPPQPKPASVQASPAAPANPDTAKPGEFNSATGKRYVLFEGTVIDSLLVNRLDGSFTGPVICLVSDDTYSHDRQHLLIPAGSKVFGDARKVDTFGQARLAVAFHRLLMPDGYSENLGQLTGLDQQGTTALHDKVNNHYLKIFGASLAVGLFSGLSEFGTGTVLTSNGADIIRQGFGVGMAESGEQIMNRFLNQMPTITIREGNRVKIYLSGDLLLPDYNHHQMDPTL